MGVFALLSLGEIQRRKKILKECSLLSAILDTWRYTFWYFREVER